MQRIIAYLQVFVGLERQNGESVDNVFVEQSRLFLFPTVRRRGPLRLLFCRQFILFAAVQFVFLSMHTLGPFTPLTAFDTLLFNIRFHFISRHVSRLAHYYKLQSVARAIGRSLRKNKTNPFLSHRESGIHTPQSILDSRERMIIKIKQTNKRKLNGFTRRGIYGDHR